MRAINDDRSSQREMPTHKRPKKKSKGLYSDKKDGKKQKKIEILEKNEKLGRLEINPGTGRRKTEMWGGT